jgi:MFS family permease
LTSFAVGVWIYETTGSPTLFAITLVLIVLPRVVLSPVSGVIADRWDRRRVMILADTGAGLSSLFILAMLATQGLELWHVYVAAFLNAAFSTLQWPAYAAATSLMVPKKHLGRAGGMTQIGEAISQLAAPAIAGALYVGTGLRWILLIDIGTYVVALLTLSLVRFSRPEGLEPGKAAKLSVWREAIGGWTTIRKMPGLFWLLILFAAMNFLINITYALYNPLILGLTSADVLGYLNSVAGLGMLVGTILMSVWGGPKRRIYAIFAAEMVLGVATFLFGLRLSVLAMAINNFFFMLAMPITNGCSQAIWQTKVAPEIQGRVFATRRMIAYSIIPVAYAVAGPLAEQLFEPWMAPDGLLATSAGRLFGTGPGHGIALIFSVCGALYSGLVLIILAHPRIRRLELEIPDAVE